jgi:hypothetical protein
MDGEVRTGLFRDGFMREHPVRYSDRSPERLRQGSAPDDPGDEESVRERLSKLGYI